MKILSLHYQRNGVSGEPFFQLIYIRKEQGFKTAAKFVATFALEDEQIDRRTCRITCINFPEFAWRGDYIADELQKHINSTFGTPDNKKGNTFYDLIETIYKANL